MKKILFLLLLLPALVVHAQPVPRKVIAEHFTNTYCSICASQNPGFYTNLRHYPQVLHIAYHPSAPYPACPLNQHNISENDARTNYYGVYGSTPRVVINGTPLTPPVSYTDSTIFVSQLGQWSSFALNVSVKEKGTDSMTILTVIRKTDTSSLLTAKLYAAVAEDTVFFTAANGETQHYDVFRKAVWGTAAINISIPANIGDSVVYSGTIRVHPLWQRRRMYAIATLQDGNKKMIQAERSTLLPPAPTAISNVEAAAGLLLWPNPADDVLYIKNDAGRAVPVTISDVYGRKLIATEGAGDIYSIDVSSLTAGYYFLQVQDGGGTCFRFYKK
jgi:hypothetical protein